MRLPEGSRPLLASASPWWTIDPCDPDSTARRRRSHDDFDALPESIEQSHEQLCRESRAPTSHEERNLRLGDAQARRQIDLAFPLGHEEGTNCANEIGLHEFLLGLWYAKIGKDVSGTDLNARALRTSCHEFWSPLAERSACPRAVRRRARMTSMSASGVSMPRFDFFWNTWST